MGLPPLRPDVRSCPGNTGAEIAAQHDTEEQFRYALNDDAMATEKLAEGIRKFAEDQQALEAQLAHST